MAHTLALCMALLTGLEKLLETAHKCDKLHVILRLDFMYRPKQQALEPASTKSSRGR